MMLTVQRFEPYTPDACGDMLALGSATRPSSRVEARQAGGANRAGNCGKRQFPIEPLLHAENPRLEL